MTKIDHFLCFRAEEEAMGLLGQGKKKQVLINSPKLLTKMLKICFQKFQDVVSAHSVLLVHLHRAKRVYNKSESECSCHLFSSS